MANSDRKIFISSDKLLLDSFYLAKKIWDDFYIPDQIVAIWRGGTPVGIAIHEFFRYKGHDPQHTAIKCEAYSGMRSTGKVEIRGLEHVIEMAQHDDRMLIVDDVFDTGLTIKTLISQIKARARRNTPEIRIAMPYYKPQKNKSGIEPDYFVRKISGWLVFPHELDGLTPHEISKKGSAFSALFSKN